MIGGAEKHEVANFHKLSGRLRLNGVLETKTALRIGSGGSRDGSDLPVLRDADGFPLVPGSSLKGVLRSTLESLVRAIEPNPRVTTCDPLQEGCGSHKTGDRAKGFEDGHCALCQLFGSPVVSSHVRISDALLRDAETLKRAGRIPIELRDGVAIDRDLRVVHGGRKYDFEVIAPGTLFDLEVFVENPQDWLMGLLVVGFDQVAEGFTALGGFTSRGLGRVTLRWEEMRRYDAATLLAGGDAEVFDPAALRGRFDVYRAALAARVKGA